MRGDFPGRDYDHWKTTDPADMELGAKQEPELEPELDHGYLPADWPTMDDDSQGEPEGDDELPF